MFNSKKLANRDPSLAALVGAIDGSDFGGDSEFAGEFAGDFGVDGFFGNDGGFFGADPVANIANAAVPMMTPPNQQAVMALWRSHAVQQAVTNRRTGLLNPNEHSLKKVERYSLTVGADVVVGTPTSINATKSPDTELRGQRISSNVIQPGFVYLSEIKVANVSVTQGDDLDAATLGPTAWGVQYDIPTLSPANRVSILGDSTALIPSGLNESDTFKFRITIQGPASMAG